MGKLSKQLEYFITSGVLLGVGLLFFVLNQGINTYTVLHFSLFQIIQSVPLLISGILGCYGDYTARKKEGLTEEGLAGAEPPAEARDAVDSVNATMSLLTAAVLVGGYYMLTMAPQGAPAPAAPLHLVICVVAFIVYACIERWWAMRMADNPEAASVCNLMVLNKAAVLALAADMLTGFAGLLSISRYVDWLILGLWVYMSAMMVFSVAWKLLRHGKDMEFRLYLPVYYAGGREENGALSWLERNTGISMRSLWSLQYIKTALPACGLGVVLLLWLSTCVVQVESYQRGALYRFGRLSQSDILEAGLHFKLPMPFESVRIYNVAQPRSMIVGYEGDVTSKNNLWTRPHEGEEQALLLGDGKELVAINLKITYTISDLYAYLTNYASPESVLNAKGYEIVMGETVNTNIDTVISGDRSVLSHRIEDRLKAYAQEEGLGLEVLSVTLASIHPPVAIADIYQNVVSADTQRKTAILAAEGEALAARERAQAQRQIAINDAGIQRDERVSTARAEVEEYNAGVEAFRLDPQAYQLNKYLEGFEKALAQRKKYLLGEGVDPGALYGAFGVQSQWFTGQSAPDSQGGQEAAPGEGN
ncbi:MAG: hypothetical protein HFF43_06490 [Lawsonibacter sp.]|jgi:regulator of protease activity HflC (stomatin/prohibitin superfamily)|nr:hypothetical protein [Lawsonibacter sp.]